MYFNFRDKNVNNMVAFKAELQNTNWGEVGEHNDPKFVYETFLDKYIAAYNKCFPLKKVKAKNCSLSKPWLSKGLLKSIRKKKIYYISNFNVNPLHTAKSDIKNIGIN